MPDGFGGRLFACGFAAHMSYLANHVTSLDAIVLYCQSRLIFPSWTSPVRIRPPASASGLPAQNVRSPMLEAVSGETPADCAHLGIALWP